MLITLASLLPWIKVGKGVATFVSKNFKSGSKEMRAFILRELDDSEALLDTLIEQTDAAIKSDGKEVVTKKDMELHLMQLVWAKRGVDRAGDMLRGTDDDPIEGPDA